MEYHEIGERFEYDGVVLEVIGHDNIPGVCPSCYFHLCNCLEPVMNCIPCERLDNKSVYYKLVEQCKTKENNNMDKKIYYADLTPCDNMYDYKEATFVPQFVLDDTKKFDTKLPSSDICLNTKKATGSTKKQA